MKYLINFSGSFWIIFAILWLLVAVSSIFDSPAVYSSDLVFVTYWLYGIWGIVMGIFIFSRMFGNTPFSLHFWRVVLLIDILILLFIFPEYCSATTHMYMRLESLFLFLQ